MSPCPKTLRHLYRFSRRPASAPAGQRNSVGVGGRKGGFTLAEMIVVIGIIVLLIGIAIPAIRALTGNRNVGAAFNQLNAIIGQARQDAMAQSDTYLYHGVMFFLDPATDRVNALFVEGKIPYNGAEVAPGAQLFIDETPNRQQIALPNGVGLWTIANYTYNASAPQSDRYIGYNPSAGNYKWGGLILFDANGRLVTVTYGLLMGGSPPDNLFGGGITPTNRPVPNSNTVTGFDSSKGYPYSQLGLVLFDRDAFKNAGFGDGNAGYDSSVSSDASQDAWLDANSTPVLINRYNGTLIKGD